MVTRPSASPLPLDSIYNDAYNRNIALLPPVLVLITSPAEGITAS